MHAADLITRERLCSTGDKKSACSYGQWKSKFSNGIDALINMKSRHLASYNNAIDSNTIWDKSNSNQDINGHISHKLLDNSQVGHVRFISALQ